MIYHTRGEQSNHYTANVVTKNPDSFYTHHDTTQIHDLFQCLTLLVTNRIFKRSLDVLSNEQSTRIIFNTLEGNYALCLLGMYFVH
jgi:adenosyl cobinamide kinase/adenosyl cobinamide phosphate guanylyltransferase